jgi:hypothetical protein
MFRRYVAAACLVLGPIALAVATAVDPALGDVPEYGVYRQHPDALQWHSLLLHWAWALFVPGLLGLLGPIRRRGSALARVAWVVTVIGMTTFAGLMMIDFVVLALEQTRSNEDTKRVFDTFEAMSWASNGWQLPAFVGWALGLVLAPLAAARARVISWWAAGVAVAGTALYLAFAIEPVPLCVVGPVVMLVGYAMAAVQLVRPRPGATPAEPDTFGRFRHVVGLACMIAAPLCFAIGMGTIPGGTYDEQAVTQHPTATQVSALFLHYAWVLFIPAVLTLARLGGRFAQVAAAVAVGGLVHFSALMVGDYTDLAVRQVLGDAVATQVSEKVEGYSLFSLGWAAPSMIATVLGLILVAVAASVDRLVPWWVPVIVVAGFVGFFVAPPAPATAVIGPLILLVGFALLARGAERARHRRVAARDAELVAVMS